MAVVRHRKQLAMGQALRHIRTCNILLQKAEEFGDKDAIAQPIGTAYFFRAWQHFYLLRLFGGVPIVDHVLDVNDGAIYGPRKSRYEVANFIISDLETAIPLLPKRNRYPCFFQRKSVKKLPKHFCESTAYEATWEKIRSYHQLRSGWKR